MKHNENAAEVDKPIAGLLKDLKARGLLERHAGHLVGEFGRTPVSESGNGRDHNPYGYTVWMAGGGVKPGFAYGATDDSAIMRRKTACTCMISMPRPGAAGPRSSEADLPLFGPRLPA